MRIVATSDLHGHLPEIPECDLLLIAGDICPDWYRAPGITALYHWQQQWLMADFYDWLKRSPAKHIVGIAGNHDWAFQRRSFSHERIPALPWNYLYDSSIEIEGLKIWGSPYSKRIGMWAFMADPDELANKWDLIPKEIDILLIHGPVYGFGDKLASTWLGEDPNSGCENLLQRIIENQFPNLKAVITGHIHEAYGLQEAHGIKWINPSHMSLDYKPINEPIIFDL